MMDRKDSSVSHDGALSFERGSVIVIHSATYLNTDKLLRSTRRKHPEVVSRKGKASEIRQVGQEAIL